MITGGGVVIDFKKRGRKMKTNFSKCHEILENNNFELCLHTCILGESELTIYENSEKDLKINITDRMIFFIDDNKNPLIAFNIDPGKLDKYLTRVLSEKK